MKMQMNNLLLLVLIVGSLIASAMGAQNEACSKILCRPGTQCKLVRGNALCQCNGTVCSDDWRPVCGSDGMTYPNKCSLNSSACGDSSIVRVAHIGRCVKPQTGRI